ncbi:MAG: hypothetical protein KI791_08475 [Cyclobacteriaceae bacterium]|nr:hypothetical protein [Cyclobacteriaceae bacterium SS2]
MQSEITYANRKNTIVKSAFRYGEFMERYELKPLGAKAPGGLIFIAHGLKPMAM